MARLPLEERSRADRDKGEAGLSALAREAAKWGVRLEGLGWDQALFALQRDPYSGEEALLARWKSSTLRGELSVREDGYVYGECDLAVRHPTDPKYWIEAVIVWGLPPRMRSEARLIEMPQ